MSTTIRPLILDDLPLLHSMLAMPEIRREYFGAVVNDDVLTDRIDYVYSQSQLMRGMALVITPVANFTEVIAYAELVQGWLAFFVHPSYRGLQYATLLADSLCKHSATSSSLLQPGSEIHTSVLRGNLASIRVLEKCGFRFKGLQWRIIAGPLPSPMLLFSRKI